MINLKFPQRKFHYKGYARKADALKNIYDVES